MPAANAAREHADNVAMNRADQDIAVYPGTAGALEPLDAATWPAWAVEADAKCRIPVTGPDGQMRYIYSKQTDLAAGPGPSRQLDERVLDKKTLEAMREAGAFHYGDQSFHAGLIQPGAEVVNYGAGASGAWGTEASVPNASSVEHMGRLPSNLRGELKVKFDEIMTRVESSDPVVRAGAERELTDFTFKEVPGNGYLPRNRESGGAFDELMQVENGGKISRSAVKDIRKIEYVVPEGGSGKRVKITIEDGTTEGRVIWKDQFVLSIGQDASAAGGPADLARNYDGKLVPIYGEPKNGTPRIVGLQSEDGSVRILGAAATPREVANLMSPTAGVSPNDQQANLRTQAADLPRDSKGVVGSYALAEQAIEAANQKLAQMLAEDEEQLALRRAAGL